MPTEKWTVAVFRRHPDDDPSESFPAEEFLDSCPQSVRKNLISIVDSVADAPPPQFTGGGMWEPMHDEMAGIYEARTQGPDHRLYRLFCVLERDAPGLDMPSLVVIAGLSKSVGSRLTRADYRKVRRLVDEYYARTPRNVM